MIRFFNNMTSWGSKSTSNKILYLVKDLARDSKSNMRISKGIATRLNAGNFRLLDSNFIENRSALVDALRQAIENTMSYKQYQRLSGQAKDDIKQRIAKALFNESLNYTTNREEIEPGAWGVPSISFSAELGISFSVQLENGKGLFEPVCANFPQDLFLRQERLEKIIKQALSNQYSTILKAQNPVLLETVLDVKRGLSLA